MQNQSNKNYVSLCVNLNSNWLLVADVKPVAKINLWFLPIIKIRVKKERFPKQQTKTMKLKDTNDNIVLLMLIASTSLSMKILSAEC